MVGDRVIGSLARGPEECENGGCLGSMVFWPVQWIPTFPDRDACSVRVGILYGRPTEGRDQRNDLDHNGGPMI